MAASWRCSGQWTVDVDSVDGAEQERLVAAACLSRGRAGVGVVTVLQRLNYGPGGWLSTIGRRAFPHHHAAIFAAYFGWMARRGADDALTGGFRRAQGPGLGWGRYQHAAVKDARTTRLDGRDSAETTSGTREGRHNKNGTLKDSKTQRHRLAHSHRQGGPTLC
ncbi:hypothetical protein SNOG_04983 [Parastagonospora nodorum SN15]|uniref:Uncharacterized protein n=1 Tax=Phaeosphaeria nodorum (strain SN15 / ATCC MYA-4574 / FGSC 10173) TaxID=321614 RepID=Q0UTD1_PHANO|nr:hypothetical protein SNOG_04983 [Parastagonospora nodorum SN15]EAT87374.1 hypothetical protein SNOG_04983 [Parastagonospora nodorum SN15]